MPTRGSGQLDQISEAIGRLQGSFEGLERYNHEREHNIADLRQAVAGVGSLVSREVARMKGELQGDLISLRSDIDKLSDRIAIVEGVQQQQVGATGLLSGILKSPLIGALIGAAISALIILNGKLPL